MKPPPLPYIVFTESKVAYGADLRNNISDRAVGVELYSEKIDHAAETLIETLLTAINYKRDRTWVETEMFFQTVYDFNLIEKF